MSALPPIPEAMATSRMVPPVRTSAFPSACGEISRALLNARPIGAAGVIQRSLGCFCLKLPATLSPPDDRMPGPRLGAHRPAAKAHTRGGQYQFERACPLAAFSEIAQDPIRELGKRKDVTVEARPLTTAKRAKSSFRRLLQRKYPHPSRGLL